MTFRKTVVILAKEKTEYMSRRLRNNPLKAFVQRLSASDRKKLIELTGATESQMRNWVAGNSKVPLAFIPKLNRAANIVANDVAQSFFPDIVINSSIIIYTMEDLTTIRIELAKKKVTQQELAKNVNVSTMTISGLS